MILLLKRIALSQHNHWRRGSAWLGSSAVGFDLEMCWWYPIPGNTVTFDVPYSAEVSDKNKARLLFIFGLIRWTSANHGKIKATWRLEIFILHLEVDLTFMNQAFAFFCLSIEASAFTGFWPQRGASTASPFEAGLFWGQTSDIEQVEISWLWLGWFNNCISTAYHKLLEYINTTVIIIFTFPYNWTWDCLLLAFWRWV